MMLCVYFGLLLVLYMFACRVKNKESHFFFAKSARENKHLSGIIMKIISNVSSRTKNPYELMRKDRKKLLCFSGCFFFVLRFNEAIRTITQKNSSKKLSARCSSVGFTFHTRVFLKQAILSIHTIVEQQQIRASKKCAYLVIKHDLMEINWNARIMSGGIGDGATKEEHIK